MDLKSLSSFGKIPHLTCRVLTNSYKSLIRTYTVNGTQKKRAYSDPNIAENEREPKSRDRNLSLNLSSRLSKAVY